MKKTFLWGITFLFIIALIPMVSGINAIETDKMHIKKTTNLTETSKETPVSTDEKVIADELTDKEKELIFSMVMEHITEDKNTETKKAILAICKNNYMCLKNTNNTSFQTSINKYSDSFLSELHNLYNKNEYNVLLNENRVYIPLVEQNGGCTVTNDEYTYIEPVASPWDMFSEGYMRGYEYPCGITVYGINHLCESGASWKEALSWYLPEFTIK